MQTEQRTLISYLAEHAVTRPNGIAMREKERGIWKEMTWPQYCDEVTAFAAALEALGVGAGQALMILGDNRLRLYAGWLGVTMLRGYAMPTYPGATLDELRHFAGEVPIAVALAEDQEQVDKALELRAGGARIDHIIYDDPRGMAGYEAENLHSWDEVLRKGRARLAAEPGLATRLHALARPGDPAVFLHSSGTTGNPKGIVLSHANVIGAAFSSLHGGVFGKDEDILAYLPMAWLGDTAVTVGAAVTFGWSVNIPEKQETVIRDMREVSPTFYFSAPRVWDNMLTQIQISMASSTRLKRAVYHFFMNRAETAERRALQGQPAGTGDRLLRVLGEWLVFRPIKDQFGLLRIRNAFSGGEALGEDTFVFYRALGVRLRQLYGQTEVSGFSAAQRPEQVKLHTVGSPLPGMELRFSEAGEILLRGEGIFHGYHGNPGATAESLSDGWLQTGDVGYLEDDGQLVVLGRISEVVHTAAGERYVPNYIENRLKFSPFIKDAAVVGAGCDWLTVMLCIDFDATGHWAETNAVPYSSYADLSQRPEVAEQLADAIRRVNATLPQGLKIRRFVSLHKEFDPDDGEITRTRKLRRKVVEARYAPVIEALHSGATEVHVEAQVTYETGATGVVERMLQIRELE